MSLFAAAAGGLGAGLVEVGNKYLDEQLQEQRATVLAGLQRTTAKNIREDDYAFRNDPTRLASDRANKAADITSEGTARGGVELQNLLNQATNQQLTDALTKRVGAEARAKAENTPFDAPPGGQRLNNKGEIVAENKRLTSAEVQKDLYERALKGDGAKTAKVDHFDDTRWAKAHDKLDKSYATFPGELGAKNDPNPELLSVYRNKLDALRQAGSIDPETAANMAMDTTKNLRRAALELSRTDPDRLVSVLEKNGIKTNEVFDKKHPLTPDRAIEMILDQAYKSAPKAAPAAGAPASPAPAKPVAPPVSMFERATGGNAPVQEDNMFASAPLWALKDLVKNRRGSPAAIASAEAEIERRNSVSAPPAEALPAVYP